MSPLDLVSHSSGQNISATAHVLEELALYGYHPGQDDPDPRPLPETESISAAIAANYEILRETLEDTRLEPDLEDLLWKLTNIFHVKANAVQRQLDDNETRQRASQDEQDGSEVRSVELEALINQGYTIMERRNAFEAMRDMAAEHFRTITGSDWRPRAGSLVNHKTMTAAVVDSRDYIAAKKYAETTVMLPPGTKIAVSGGGNFNDVNFVYAKLDMLLSRFPDMVLIHGGYDKGVDKIAACWARNRGVTAIPFPPDFKKYPNRAGFVRNDEIIKLRPRGVLVFDGTGVQHQMARIAKEAGIPLNDYREVRAAK